MAEKIVIGTRGSKLALWQANWVRDTLLKLNPEIEVSLTIIKTQGDKILDVPLAKIGGKGLFVKEIESALIEKEIDIAVHSMKDMPSEVPPELMISAITERENPSDALLSFKGEKIDELKKDALVGTSSLRRRVHLYNISSEFVISDLRGNLDTRIRKLQEGKFDAIVVAAAGVNRLGFTDLITQVLPNDLFLPAVGQGALGIETRKDDNRVLDLVKSFNHHQTAVCVTAERGFLKRLEGGCQVPIAAYGIVSSLSPETMTLEGLVGSIDGKRIIREKISDSSDKAYELGVTLAETLLQKGAGKILQDVYGRDIL